MRNITFSTSLYAPTSNKINNPLVLGELPSTTLLDSSVRNFFASTSFTDLLQQGDLQTLNTINASTNAASRLYLNCNYSSTDFKS